MKKHKMLFTAVIAAAAAAAFTCTASAQAKTVNLQIDNPQMSVNGEVSELDSPPVIRDGRTLVPIRAIVEALDGKVDWDNETKTATLTNDSGDEVKLTVNSKTASYNGSSAELDTPPVIINERTMLPIRFVAESFGYTADWKAEDKSIVISGGSDEDITYPDIPEDEFYLSYTDKDGNSYTYKQVGDEGFIEKTDKSGKLIAKYKEIAGNEEIYKNSKGETLTYAYYLENDTSTITLHSTGEVITSDSDYNMTDKAGNDYGFADYGIIDVKDKSGKVISEYVTTNELRYPYADDSGNVYYKVLRRNGTYEDGFLAPDGSYTPFEDNYDWSFMGSDNKIYNFKYDYIIVTDDSYNKLDEWKTGIEDTKDIYLDDNSIEYIFTGDMAETYVLRSEDKTVTVTCDPEEEHNKKLFATGEYGTEDAIYYNGDDGNIYVHQNNIFTVYNAGGEKINRIRLFRSDTEYKSANNKKYIYSYNYDTEQYFVEGENGTVELNEIMG